MQAFHDGSIKSIPRTESATCNGGFVLDPFCISLPTDGLIFTDHHHEGRFDTMMSDPLMHGGPPPPPSSKATPSFSNHQKDPTSSGGIAKSSPSSSKTAAVPSQPSKSAGKTITIKPQQKQKQAPKTKKVPEKAVSQTNSFKMKKAPGAPRRFKSAYMFFSTKKHKEFREELNKNGQAKMNTTDVAKLVSKAWKSLSAEERKEWDDVALADKKRYEVERAAYKGPWKVPTISAASAGKDPTAPKRPMSAFLAFSNDNRKAVKSVHAEMSNADITRILGQMWKELSAEDRRVYQEKEVLMRNKYKVVLEDWKKEKQATIMANPKKRRKKKQDEPPAKKSNGKEKSVPKTSDAISGVVGRGKKSPARAEKKNKNTKKGTDGNKTAENGPASPHDYESPSCHFETKMAQDTFGHALKISQSHKLEENSNVMFPIESPESYRTGDESDPSHLGWRDWQYSDSRQDVSTGDRIAIAPIEGPSYFPNNSMKMVDETGVHFYYLDDANSRRFHLDREDRTGRYSVPVTPTAYAPDYRSNVAVSYSRGHTTYGLKPNALTSGAHYQYHSTSSTEGWYHSSDRQATANQHYGGAQIRTHYETRDYPTYY
mmetsp:Transcript_62851/g.153031  ORF Transcript_62851/g.153031 Transcript_62851/m.153031 type:complete len:600 (+) Transcript_62851:632-2431(+)